LGDHIKNREIGGVQRTHRRGEKHKFEIIKRKIKRPAGRKWEYWNWSQCRSVGGDRIQCFYGPVTSFCEEKGSRTCGFLNP